MAIITQYLNRWGLWPMVGLATLISVLASIVITWTIHRLYLNIEPPPQALAISIVCPLIIAPIMSGLTFNLLLQLHRAHERLIRINDSDYLTELYNRRYFMTQLRSEIERTNRYGSHFSLAFIDIDNFKSINDRHGHLGGDEVLKRLAAECMACVRQTDTFARIGGEEFAMLLPETGPEDAQRMVERLRSRVESLPIPVDDEAIHVTVSIGLTSQTGELEHINSVLRRADEALYAAKRQGKNRVVSEYALAPSA